MTYHKIKINNISIFYRECGNPQNLVMVLFHDFPSSSHQFRDLMPLLESKFHLIAPDYPGFAQSESPSRSDFAYTFDNIANLMDDFLSALKIEKFFMYVFDYGTPENSVSPDGYSLDLYYAATIPDYAEKQSDLIFDYQTNVALYPAFQKYLRENKPKLLAVWEKNDPSFIWQGVLAFKKDLPDARIVGVESGHFALENCAREIAEEMLEFFCSSKST